MQAEEILRKGQLGAALDQLQEEVRGDPSSVKLRIFMFQLLALSGQWQRALTQLNVLREIDAGSLPMVHAYREALRCEALREEVFSAERSPLIFGDPEPWIARMVEAIRLEADGSYEEAARLREGALEEAEASSGSIDGNDFEWLADADSRLGPLLEAVVNGRYYWVPFHRIRRIGLEAPEDLRDLVWAPAQLTWANAGECVALVPVRYPGIARDDDPQILMSRRTEWTSPVADVYHGRGQRILVTDRDEYPLLEARQIDFANEEPAAEPSRG